MANLSVEKLATVIGSEPKLLLSQMQEAGLTHSNLSDDVTDNDKKILLIIDKKIDKKFDIIFIDPPYKEMKINMLIEKIIYRKLIKNVISKPNLGFIFEDRYLQSF